MAIFAYTFATHTTFITSEDTFVGNCRLLKTGGCNNTTEKGKTRLILAEEFWVPLARAKHVFFGWHIS